MERVKVAFIGAGSMANRVHYPSLASFDDVELVGICDLDPQRLAQTADKYGIAGRFTDYRTMIEATAPDAVYAVGHPHLMYDLWVWCLERGLNLFVEKPLGLTLHQARNLAWLAERRGCVTQVGFQRRCCPLLVKLRDECLARGPLQFALARFYKHEPQKPYLAARDHLLDDGVHALDTVRWLCGGEATRLRSVCRRRGTPDINQLHATIEFDTGAVGQINCSWTSGRRIFAVELHGEGICAEADLEGRGVLYADGDTVGQVYETTAVAGSDEFYIHGGFRAKNREFIDAIKSGGQPSSCFADAVKTMILAERILAEAVVEGSG